ncbi:glycosyltransferase family 2 protein [Lutimaribacter sp. EGI FJ00015]|uniref:Glycosyltransferase family 2 protein n=1 Tax=Lutimaribacter degradans TaxID=2945989 RepID=A0ACC6A2G4_9RHOB|nr:glycosyltransferase family 2 protein [Lutimaribacter sp. EGI FJ00013]MCM2563949.1 glycosyltransferase family 2 protein [Lutimaribacter sp. EGI FJ00013]MCO0615212.1 glycosyltransferase family 2 protein [Lutimaribacter sp. EGI FJ00015]MCO0637805.1 glycosyltransferase family 2 protein [Lutimaribacter sp. EGI FJ00014]
MSVSFIVTTYNIEPYIRQCLESLRDCVREGDQVILVDDGSTDSTEQAVLDFVEEIGFGNNVNWTPIWLGTNTIGGVGIGANIGMDHAECDTIFFVDGDDYMLPEGFNKARNAYESHPADISLSDYLEYDQRNNRTKPPADTRKWDGLSATMDLESSRIAAIDLIAVPWRKFYRTAFLRENRIRFPEGDFFFEDNPFHWYVCTRAKSIHFSRHIVCHHRVNRPGQTMASTGVELTAFFTHYSIITSNLPDLSTELRIQAAKWLVNQVSWHIGRLQPSAFRPYAVRAAATLQQISEEVWQELSKEMSEKMVWHYANSLREGKVFEVVESWMAIADRRLLQRVDQGIKDLNRLLRDIERQVKMSREIAQSKQALDEFTAISDIVNAY